MTYPIFYTFRRCPYAMRARMAVYKAGIDHEHREVVLRDKPAHMLEISPKGTVPVLLTSDGDVLEESLDIMRWALSRNDPDNWLGPDPETRDALISRNDNEFKGALDRYKYPDRFPDEDTSDAREKGLDILKDLNERLEKNGQLLSSGPSFADIAIFPFVRQFAHVDRDWFNGLDLAPLQTWLENHKTSELFSKIMPKYQKWTPDSDRLVISFETHPA